jgi:hypothetical protein
MINRSLSALLLLLLVACASTPAATPSPESTPAPAMAPVTDILGVRLDMPRDAVRGALTTIGTFEREERKRQEIWTVRDPRFSSLMIGYDSNWKVRYVTAVADPAGAPVTYADVLEVSTADLRSAGDTHTYTWKTGTPPYYVIAIGGPERLTYLSLKKDPQAN